MLPSVELSPEEFLIYAEKHEDKRFDFIDGEMVEVIPTPRTAYIKAVIAAELGAYVKTHPIGIAYLGVLHVLDGEIPGDAIGIEERSSGHFFDAMGTPAGHPQLVRGDDALVALVPHDAQGRLAETFELDRKRHGGCILAAPCARDVMRDEILAASSAVL